VAAKIMTKSEWRNPKEIRMTKPETPTIGATVSVIRVSLLIRHSPFVIHHSDHGRYRSKAEAELA